MSIISKLFRITVFFSLLLLTGLLFTQKINLTTADIGRHIKNGAIFVQKGEILNTNYYSYTQPDYHVINHHGGSGVLFYYVWLFFGFKGLSIFYTGLFLITFCLFFYLARAYSTFAWAYVFSVLSVPLVVSRFEIRPEGFSYFFLGLFLLILYKIRQGDLSPRWLWVLPALQVLWVNIHIFFFLGPLLVFFFLADFWLNRESTPLVKSFQTLFVILILTCFINPFGFEGALVPLTIFKEYGYRLAENQSVIFMQKRFPRNELYPHFEVSFALIFLSLIWLRLKTDLFRRHAFLVILFVFFSALAWKAIRGISLFGFILIPCASIIFYSLSKEYFSRWGKRISKILFCLAFAVVLSGFFWKNYYYSPYKNLQLAYFMPELKGTRFWAIDLIKKIDQVPGLAPGINASASFFKDNHLEGPIFNNYDIGGFLIFHLFPQEGLFVDNRPEAYSVSFFKDTYVPMQERDDLWQKMDQTYQFNVIYFNRHDLTPWGQNFLIQRIKDPLWAPVFVDGYTLILLKRNLKNARMITQFELPKSLFKTSN